MSNFTFFHNVFYAICILKSLNSHISVVICSFFEFRTVSKWCIREWYKTRCCIRTVVSLPITRQQMLDWSKLKDDNFEFNENSKKFSDQVENTVGKGEFACYEQSLLFPQCFQKARFPGASKGVIVWEWIKAVNCLIQVVSKTGLTVCFLFFQTRKVERKNNLKI